MAFTKQGGNIEQALVSGGLTPMAANAVMYAIANCAQPLEHRGPFTINYVPQQVRLTTPERAKYSYEKFNFQTSEGERRPVKITSKNPDDPTPDPNNPDPPVDGGCDLTTTCDRLDSLEAAMEQVFGAVGELAAKLMELNAELGKLEQRVSAIEEKLNNTTDCPQGEPAAP